ncbi:nickel transporter permease [Paenibacillus sp. FSL H8-0079]|uniref:nickel transporter permease n=1 Tax=Paenibacillus sp. FSL H8-0079 TaxID=2921375 RepID=UPI0030ED0898
MKCIPILLGKIYYWIGAAGIGFAGLIVLALLAPSFITQDPYRVEMGMRLQSPSMSHWLGTDGLGRDLFTRLLVGGRNTLGTSVAVLCTALAIGIPIGLISGYFGGIMDRIFMRIADAFLAFPDFLVAIVLSGLLGPHIVNLMIAIAAVKWIAYARVVRNTVRAERNKEYVAIARMNGVGPLRLIQKHMLPHVIRHVIVLASLDIGKIILIIASLSYVGLGIQPPGAEWGAMLNEGKTYFLQSPYLMIWPGAAIMFTVALANLTGDRIQDRLGRASREGGHT